MQKVILASGNSGKVREFEQLFAGSAVQIIPQKEYKIPDVEETGTTFIENAIIKARHAAQLSGLPAIADDSGIVVDALDGAPGIYSARYAGEHGNAIANREKVLTQLQGVPTEKRTARFVCCLVLMQHADDPLPLISHGTLEGVITEQPEGDNGFGYDPILYIPEHHCTAAQLAPEIKNQISHRGRAMQQLFQLLQQHQLI